MKKKSLKPPYKGGTQKSNFIHRAKKKKNITQYLNDHLSRHYMFLRFNPQASVTLCVI